MDGESKAEDKPGGEPGTEIAAQVACRRMHERQPGGHAAIAAALPSYRPQPPLVSSVTAPARPSLSVGRSPPAAAPPRARVASCSPRPAHPFRSAPRRPHTRTSAHGRRHQIRWKTQGPARRPARQPRLLLAMVLPPPTYGAVVAAPCATTTSQPPPRPAPDGALRGA
ncbi:hypothetical protein PVAP13_7NG394820 [Panicum virgatum]|uniref:Uncharacterized protein n=1 Tax=Panicum virgatum TaxID=38727 RepID=A0A8T0Q8D1_PANVG|nr:hypothetical protein PVAP13_7NG394820 [Panicum virgatum]